MKFLSECFPECRIGHESASRASNDWRARQVTEYKGLKFKLKRKVPVRTYVSVVWNEMFHCLHEFHYFDCLICRISMIVGVSIKIQYLKMLVSSINTSRSTTELILILKTTSHIKMQKVISEVHWILAS